MSPLSVSYILSLHDALPILACKIRGLMVTVCPSQFATRRTLFHVLVGCGLLMLKVKKRPACSELRRSEERFSRNAETDVGWRLRVGKKKTDKNEENRAVTYK